jgi:ABC-type nitrate/sulfonate/bicarbonate transport system permease component
VVVFWESTSYLGLYNLKLLPPPSQIIKAFFRMVRTGEWITDVEATLSRYAIGFILGAIFGVLVGVATGRLKVLYYAVAPLMNFLRSTPSVALVPLSIVLLGIGEAAKFFVIAWGVFFPVWIATHTGVRNVTPAYEWAARSLGARRTELLMEVIFPQALPYIASGIRIGVATGFFALAAAEMAGAYAGVAFRIFFAQQGFRTDEMMVAILTIGGLGFAADFVFVTLTKLAIPWLRSDDARS